MMKYWVYLDGQVPGCYLPNELASLEGFGMTTLVCPAEGEISEKNWRRAGEIEELAMLVKQAEIAAKPKAPVEAPAPSADVNDLIDTASQRLFTHVAELMKELEDRRDEKALTDSLQRQLAAYKADLTAEREKNALAENRLARISELEQQRTRDLDLIAKLEAGVRARDEAMSKLRADFDGMKNEFETTKRRLGEVMNDLSVRNRLVDKISKDLTEKELSLAKSLAVIRRLEEDLHRLMPRAAQPRFKAAAKAAEPPKPVEPPKDEKAASGSEPTPLPEPEPKTELSLPEAPPPAAAAPETPASHRFTPRAWLRRSDSTPVAKPSSGFTTDDPPLSPPVIEPPDPEKLGAQNALVDFFRRVMKKEPPQS